MSKRLIWNMFCAIAALCAIALVQAARAQYSATGTQAPVELRAGQGTGKLLSSHSTHDLCLRAAEDASKTAGSIKDLVYTCRAPAGNVTVKFSPIVAPAPTWSKCADERTRCTFAGRREVRYGDGASVWVVRVHEGGVECTNDVFGDPAVGNLKRCEASSAVTAKPITPPIVVAPPVVVVPPVVTPPVVTPPVVVPPVTAPTARDPLRQPFASSSIWNTAIGSGAVYVPAGLTSVYGDAWASMPYADEDVIVFTPAAPLVDVREGPWAGDRCNPTTTKVFARVPIPTNYTNPSSNNNMASGILLANGRTIVNVQPLTRCAAGGLATSIVRWPDSDLYGDGIDGAHGGSGMSSVGGALRVGEMRKGAADGPRHAIKLIVNMREAFRCTSMSSCYRWPAKAADGYALGHYGSSKQGATDLKMGALLAIPPTATASAIGLETEPGRQLFWTLQNYGGYVVDDSYGGQFGIATETGPAGSFVQQFAADFGFGFHARQNAAGAQAGWMRDVQRLVKALHIVANNGPAAIGGGGAPRQPAAPPIAP